MPDDTRHVHAADLRRTDKHESDTTGVRVVTIFGLGLLVLVAVASLIVWGLWDVLESNIEAGQPPVSPLRAQVEHQLPASPRLQVNEPRDLQQFLAQEDAVLNSYGWVDKQQGIVHIPIDEAMKLYVQEVQSGKVQP